MDGRLVKVGLEKPISSFHFIEHHLGCALSLKFFKNEICI
jgi:hypothetical protein